MWLGLSFITISGEAINLIIKIGSNKFNIFTKIDKITIKPKLEININDPIFIRNEHAQRFNMKNPLNQRSFLQDF